MAYVDGVITAVPTANKQAYIAYSQLCEVVFRACGATGYADCWGDDVPKGKVTDFLRAVQATEEETVTFGWVAWPDKAVRDAGWAKAMQDERLTKPAMPFDGKRMVFGGFDVVVGG
jgi:uncharacterized protein YbaA (DUF1428 family)